MNILVICKSMASADKMRRETVVDGERVKFKFVVPYQVLAGYGADMVLCCGWWHRSKGESKHWWDRVQCRLKPGGKVYRI